jgi:hypothetical protein
MSKKSSEGGMGSPYRIVNGEKKYFEREYLDKNGTHFVYNDPSSVVRGRTDEEVGDPSSVVRKDGGFYGHFKAGTNPDRSGFAKL